MNEQLGQFEGCNDYIRKASRQKVESVSLYSLMVDPMTTCGCCECIAAVLPMCNGVMTVDRDYLDMTPCGMKFTSLAGSVGGGAQTPGFLGHSKYNITQRKFLKGDGGLLRIAWMPKRLKDEIYDRLKKRGEELGYPDLPDMIADETVAGTEEEVLEYITEKGHPCVAMEAMLLSVKETNMALTGIQIFKLLPKTNCGECKFPTCLAFAMALAAGKSELSLCPHVSDEAREQLSEASAPPIRPVTIGTGEYEVKIGGETVLFRHEKTFFNKPGLAILITDTMDDEEVARRFATLGEFQYERVGLIMKPELVALKDTGNRERFLALVEKACALPYSMIMMSLDLAVMAEALKSRKEENPLSTGPQKKITRPWASWRRNIPAPSPVKGAGLEEVASLTESLTALGLKDLVIDTSTRTVKKGFEEQIIIRRAALTSKYKPLGFPTITFPAEMADDLMKETLIASCFVAKYAGLIVMSDFLGESIFPLLLQRLNIYTDPQRPMTTTEGIYPVNNPDENSPVLITCNFSLTYFIVTGEIENSRVPAWLLVMDTEGLSVMTAWAAGKFVGDLVAAFIKKSGIEDKVKHRKLIIPGYAAVILGDIEEELPGWEIQVGPREAAHIPAYLKMWKAE